MPYKDLEKKRATRRKYYREHRDQFRVYSRRWRERHPEYYSRWRACNKDRTKDANFKWYAKSQVWGAIVWYKLLHPCTDCNETDPLVLEFDHVPERGEKRLRVGNAYKWTPKRLPELLAEIQKCEVVCANCHKRRTELRRPHSHILQLLDSIPLVV